MKRMGGKKETKINMGRKDRTSEGNKEENNKSGKE